ncbi:MAG: hypothetical protein RLZZ253_1292 [Verrucomicrobiota bacterium]|jgi:hypothetical protein
MNRSMAIWAHRSQIGYRIDRILLSDIRQLLQVVNMYKSLCDITKLRTKTKLANTTISPVVCDTSRASSWVALIRIHFNPANSSF